MDNPFEKSENLVRGGVFVDVRGKGEGASGEGGKIVQTIIEGLLLISKSISGE